MSFEALAWAAKVRTSHSTDKLVLLGLAENASRDDAEAWPSIASLCEFGSLNRKTVIAALDRLITAGLIVETGEHKGRTGQVKVYRLNLSNSPEIGTVKQSQNRDRSQKRNSSDFTRKQSQKRDTEPMKEPIPLVSTNVDTSPSLKPEHVVEAWNAMAEPLGLSMVRVLSKGRMRSLKARLREFPDVDDWTEAIGAIERSPFLQGREGKGGWRANFDFLLQPSSFIKLIEGSYDRQSAA